MSTSKLKQYFWILVILINQSLSSTCTTGCLSCQQFGFEEPKCTMCDSRESFYMLDGKCVKSEIHGCSLLTFEGKCHACVKHHYLDFKSGSCIRVPLSNAIENCEYYKTINACLACFPGFYYSLEDEKCLKVSEPIENCEYYKSNSKCMRCAADYWVNYENDKCLKIDGDNCAVANVLRCGYCKNNYFSSQNYALTNLNQSLAQILLARFLSYDVTPFLKIEQSTCVRQIDENCLVFLDATNCMVCKSGYFLYDVDKRCYEKPSVSVPHCKYYQDLTTCLECEEGYHRSTPSSCIANEVLPNCLSYYNDSSSTFCVLCEEG